MEPYFLNPQGFDEDCREGSIPICVVLGSFLQSPVALLGWHYAKQGVKDFISAAARASECVPNFWYDFTL